MIATSTLPWRSERMGTSRLVDQCDEVAFLDGGLGLDVELTDNPRHLGHDRDFHLHRLEDHDLVALGNHLPFIDDDLPDVGRDFGADLVHDSGRLAVGG